MQQIRRIRTSTWALIGVFLVTLVVYLWVKPPSTPKPSYSYVPVTTPATSTPATSAPTVTPTSPRPTISSPRPSLKAGPTVSATPTPTPTSSPSSVVSPAPSATLPPTP
ncbi:MAG: hypothetical protein ABSB76_41360 [Streptosporangiaceae bacterium]